MTTVAFSGFVRPSSVAMTAFGVLESRYLFAPVADLARFIGLVRRWSR